MKRNRNVRSGQIKICLLFHQKISKCQVKKNEFVFLLSYPDAECSVLLQ